MAEALVEAKRQDVADAREAPANDLEVIERLIHDPSVDVAKVQALFEIRLQMIEDQRKQAFQQAMRAAKKDMPATIKRNKTNSQTSSTYADLTAVSNALDPIIHRHDLDLSYDSADSPLANHYRILCLVSHGGGYTREYHVDVPIDSTGPKGQQNKTLTHAFGSTLSYGRRYLKMMIFDVATSDDDGNAAGSETITEEQADELDLLIGHAKADKGAFLKMCGVETLDALPVKKFEGAKKRLIAKRDAQ